MTTRDRLPYIALYVVAFIAVCAVVFVLFSIALGADIGNVIVVVVAFGIIGAIGIVIMRSVTQTGLSIADKRLSFQAETNRHDESMAKLGLHPQTFAPLHAPQLLPQQITPSDERYTDPRRKFALRVLTATVDSKDYGPQSSKIITQADAKLVGIVADDWGSGVDYLKDFFGVATGNRGTIIKEEGKTVSRVFAEFASVAQTVTDSAVMALEERKR